MGRPQVCPFGMIESPMRTVLCFVFFSFACHVHAFEPVMVTPQNVEDVVVIDDTSELYGYYGELDDFPHTFIIASTEPFVLRAQILEPDTSKAKHVLRGIIVRDRDNGRGVEEVARISPDSASWESFYKVAYGVRYLQGPEYQEELGAGTYRIEVSTPLNKGKYVLVLGNPEGGNSPGYFGTLRDIYEVNHFFGRPPIALIVSPYVFLPLIVVVVVGLVLLRFYRKRYA